MSDPVKGAYKLISLESLNSGQVIDLFDREFGRVMDNIADENTSAKAKREITIKISIKPDEDRGRADISISASTTLAQVKESKSFCVFSFDGHKVTAYQADPKQIPLGIDDPKVINMPKAAGGNS